MSNPGGLEGKDAVNAVIAQQADFRRDRTGTAAIQSKLDELGRQLGVPGTPVDRMVELSTEIGNLGKELKRVQKGDAGINAAESEAHETLNELGIKLEAVGFPADKIKAGFTLMAVGLQGGVVLASSEEIAGVPAVSDEGKEKKKKAVLPLKNGRILSDDVLLETGSRGAILENADSLQTRFILAHFLADHRTQLEKMGVADNTCDWSKLKTEEDKLGTRLDNQSKSQEIECQEHDRQVFLSKGVVRLVLATCGDGKYAEQRKSIINAIHTHAAWTMATKMREAAIRQGKEKEFDAMLGELDDKASGYTVQFDNCTHTFSAQVGNHLKG